MASTQAPASGVPEVLVTRPEIVPPGAITSLIPVVVPPDVTVTGVPACGVGFWWYHPLP